ncbi:hypothetical protein GH714_015451 [Hevea brasiliensis]|uniref:Uncharacterized protein n=1 Tax=Hevea brasiliensis TaxID=3981 RepID=A0A6A6KRW4_HEVBR|nr:hypothetical protein GH714_015451 [Hevea brasiliensis]
MNKIEKQAYLELSAVDGYGSTHDGRVNRDAISRSYNEAKGLWNVAFPLINMIGELVGRNRAIEKGVETFDDAIENMEKEMTVDLDKDYLFEDITGNHSAKAPQNSKEKKSKVSHDDDMSTNFNMFMEQMNTHLDVIANVWADQQAIEKEIAYENKRVAKQKKMMNEIISSE